MREGLEKIYSGVYPKMAKSKEFVLHNEFQKKKTTKRESYE